MQKYTDKKPEYLTQPRRTPDEDRIYTPDEVEFMTAMDNYKRRNQRPFPTWKEVLDVLLSLGYRKGDS